MASTLGSSAASEMNSTTSSNDSYGWCSSTSRSAMTRKMSSYSCSGGTICGENGSSRSSRSSSRRADGREVGQVQRAVERGRRRRARGAAPSAGSSRTSGGVSCAISRRTALPRSRRRSSFWIVLSRSSASSSSIDRSKLRVTRKALQPSDAEAGEELADVHGDQVLEQHEGAAGAGAAGRHLDEAREHRRAPAPRAKIVCRRATRSRSLCSRTARLRLRLRSSGKGWPGSTASGVRTGQTSLGEVAPTAAPSARASDLPARSSRMPACVEPGRDLVAPDAVLLGRPWRGRAR